jgi:hypothetical protein
MSVVTDLVFVTPSFDAAKQFADMFEARRHGRHDTSWRPVEVESNGSKFSGTHVFHMGVNYIDLDLVTELRGHPWPDGTVLYTLDECHHTPDVTTWRGGIATHVEGEADRW